MEGSQSDPCPKKGDKTEKELFTENYPSFLNYLYAIRQLNLWKKHQKQYIIVHG